MQNQVKDTIMGFLREYYVKNGRHFYKDFNDLRRALPDVEPRIMQFTLNRLKRDGLVNFITGHEKPLGITLTPSGMAYLDQERKKGKDGHAETSIKSTGFGRGVDALRQLFSGRKLDGQ